MSSADKIYPKDLFWREKGLNRIFLVAIISLLLMATLSANAAGEIRGKATDLGQDTFIWDCKNFAGFYYDIDSDICTEKITFHLSDISLDKSRAIISEPDGVKYETYTALENFEFESWERYNIIGFMGERYFAEYLDTPYTNNDILYHQSGDKNVLSNEQVLQILIDSDDERTVTTGAPLELEEGYELSIAAVDIDGNKVYVELHKDGAVVDSKVIFPSADNAGMKDKTYYYKKDIGDSKDVVIVAAHFKKAFHGADQNLAIVDGIWQLSDTPKDVSENTEYDKMTIQAVTANSITMNIEDNDITLIKNKDISLMPGIGIRTADQDVINENNPLRYYIYKNY